MIVLLLFIAGVSSAHVGQQAEHIKAAETAYEDGMVALRKKNLTDAAAQFRQAIRIEPTYTAAYEALIQACLDDSKPLEAGAAATQLLEIEPELKRYRLLLGRILLDEQQPQRALSQFSLILKNDPSDADALFGFASAAKASGMQDRASEALERGRKLHPHDGRFRSTL